MVRKVNYTEAEKLAKKMGKNVGDVLDSYAKMKIILVDNSKESAYQAEIGKLQKDAQDKGAKVAEYEGQLKEKEGTVAELQEGIRKTREDYDSKINKQAEEIEAIRKQLETNGGMVEVLQKQVGDLNKDLGEKAEQLQRMEGDAKNREDYIGQMENMVTTFINVPLDKLKKLDEELNEEPKAEELPVAAAYAVDNVQSLPGKPGAVEAPLPEYKKVTDEEPSDEDTEEKGDVEELLKEATVEELEEKYGNVIPLGKHESVIRDLGYDERDGIVKDKVFYTDNGSAAIAVEEEIELRNKRKKEEESKSVQKYMDMGEAIGATKSGRKVKKGFVVAFKQDWRQKWDKIEPIKLNGIEPDDVFALFEKYGDEIATNNVLDEDKGILVPATVKDGSHYRGFIKKKGYKEIENGWEKRKVEKKEPDLYDEFEYVVNLESHNEIVDSEVFKQRGKFKDGYYGTNNPRVFNSITKAIKKCKEVQIEPEPKPEGEPVLIGEFNDLDRN